MYTLISVSNWLDWNVLVACDMLANLCQINFISNCTYFLNINIHLFVFCVCLLRIRWKYLLMWWVIGLINWDLLSNQNHNITLLLFSSVERAGPRWRNQALTYLAWVQPRHNMLQSVHWCYALLFKRYFHRIIRMVRYYKGTQLLQRRNKVFT